jgi:drug/metabolite transporter (DMT)-like permease
VLAAVFTTTVWGGQFVVGRAAFPHVHPVWVTTLRYLAAGAVLALILGVREGWESFRWNRQTARAYTLGAIGFAGFNLLVYVGLAHTRPQNASLIVATMPLLTAFVLWARTKTRPATSTAVAAGVALLGVAVVLTDGRVGSFAHDGVGGPDLLVLAGVAAWVVYTTGSASLPGFSPLRYTGVSVVGGAVTITAITALLSATDLVPVPSGPDVVSVGWQLGYLAVPGAVLAMLTWNGAVRALGAQDVSLFITLVPTTTFAIEAFLGQRPDLTQLAGVALVLVAVVGANLAARRSRPADAAALAPATCAVRMECRATSSVQAAS